MKGVKIPALGNTLISLLIDYSSLWQIQTEAARIATGTTKLVSIENLYLVLKETQCFYMQFLGLKIIDFKICFNSVFLTSNKDIDCIVSS